MLILYCAASAAPVHFSAYSISPESRVAKLFSRNLQDAFWTCSAPVICISETLSYLSLVPTEDKYRVVTTKAKGVRERRPYTELARLVWHVI